MRQFLAKQFLGNSLQLWLEVLFAVLIAFVIKRFISKYIARLLFKIITKTGTRKNKDYFIGLIVRPLERFIVTLIIIIAFNKLYFPAFLDFDIYKFSSHQLLDAVANTSLIVTFILLCIRMVQFVGFLLERKAKKNGDQSHGQLIIFFKDFIRVILVLIGILLVLKFVFSYNIGNLVTGLSLVGAAVALATKESLENLIASFIIFFDKPFTTGDLVKVLNFTGVVEKIGLRSTRIRTDQKTYITVPNKQMVDTILDNITLRTQRRVQLTLEIALSVPVAQLKQLVPAIQEILKKETIEDYTAFFSDTGKNAHIISIEYFTTMSQTFPEFNILREQVNFEISDLLKENNIPLASSAPATVIMQK